VIMGVRVRTTTKGASAPSRATTHKGLAAALSRNPLSALLLSFRTLVAAPTPAFLAVVAVAMTTVSWPVMSLAPQAGLDASWAAGLAMALENHLPWGPRIDFTYGPLGFLVVPTLYYKTTAILSICYMFISRLLLFALLLRASYREFPPNFAVLAAFLVGATAVALVDPADILMGVELLLAIEAFRSQNPRTAAAARVALAALSGAGLLVKFSVGLLGLGLTAVVAASSPRWKRHAAETVGTFIGIVVAMWCVTGNSISDLPLYLRMSTAIAAGYAGAMSLEVGRVDEWYYAALILACLGACLALSLRVVERRRRLCVALAFLGFSWVALKEGYVRHDGHDLEFFGLMLVAFIAVPLTRSSPPPARLGGALGLATVFAWTAAGAVPSNVLDFSNDVHQLAASVATVLARGRADSAIAQARATLQSGYQLPPWFLSKLRGHTLAIEPYENTVAWAYPQLKWDPEPILQQYSAYEASLDNLDARFLRSAHAPTYILAQPAVPFQGIDQNTYFEAPTADVVMLCRYRQAGATAAWQLLVRVPDRCGKLIHVKTVYARFGQSIAVPKPRSGDAIVATFHGVGSSVLYRLENLVLKARAIQMTVPGTSYRFIAGTGQDLHIMRTTSTLGYNAPYSPPQIDSFTMYERNLFNDGGRYTINFFTMHIAAARH
jgi:hypothetical protein